MATKYVTYITEEERIAAEEKGLNRALEIIELLKEGVSVAEIASRFKVSTSHVELFRVAL